MSKTRVLIAFHKLQTGFNARITAQLGYYLNAEGTDIAPVLKSPESSQRSLSSVAEDSESKKAGYEERKVGTYPEEKNSLANEGPEALKALKVELDDYISQVKKGAQLNLYIFLEFNFGYSGYDVSIARIAKEYLGMHLKEYLDKISITFTLDGTGGSKPDSTSKAKIKADTSKVFEGFSMNDVEDNYFCTKAETENLFSSKRSKTGIFLVPLSKEAMGEIEALVGKTSSTGRLSRKSSREHFGFRGKGTPKASGIAELSEFPNLTVTGTSSSMFSSSSSSTSSSSSSSASPSTSSSSEVDTRSVAPPAKERPAP